MTGRTDADLIAEATAWFVRLRENGDDATRMGVRRWMARDLRHAAAIDMVERSWGKAGVLAPAAPERIAPPRARNRRFGPRGRQRSPRMLGWAVGMAAAVLLMIGAEYRGLGIGWPRDYATRAAPRDIALVDGSLLRLQPHSRATVRLSLLARDITLDSGRGDFAVAHETMRAFVVHAGTIGVEATGTRFSVRRDPAGTHVALWRGGVRLRDRASNAVLAYMKPGDRADVGGGGRMILTHPRPTPRTVPNLFVFDEMPLADAVRQIATGTGLTVRFARPDLARLPVSSVYHGSNLPAFLDDLKAVEPICWRQRGSVIDISDGSPGCGTQRPVS